MLAVKKNVFSAVLKLTKGHISSIIYLRMDRAHATSNSALAYSGRLEMLRKHFRRLSRLMLGSCVYDRWVARIRSAQRELRIAGRHRQVCTSLTLLTDLNKSIAFKPIHELSGCCYVYHPGRAMTLKKEDPLTYLRYVYAPAPNRRGH